MASIRVASVSIVKKKKKKKEREKERGRKEREGKNEEKKKARKGKINTCWILRAQADVEKKLLPQKIRKGRSGVT